MSFMNKKEDVYDIKLTSHGKKLFSKGVFSPQYYAFFDDDIIYDTNFASSSYAEDQNDIEPRIKSMPSLHSLYSFTRLDNMELKIPGSMLIGHLDAASAFTAMQLLWDGPYTNIAHSETSGMLSWSEWYDAKLDTGILTNYSLQEPIGTAEMGQRHMPAWDMELFLGEIDSTQQYMKKVVGETTSLAFPIVKIPQIEMSATHFTSIYYDTEYAENSETYSEKALHDSPDNEMGMMIIPFPAVDGTVMLSEEGIIVLELAEKNVDYLKENFDIEVFLIENESTTEEEWTQLYFSDSSITHSNPFYMPYASAAETAPTMATPEIANLSNYLEIMADEEIPEEIICALLKISKKKDIFEDLIFNCEEQESFAFEPAATYDQTPEDFGEIC